MNKKAISYKRISAKDQSNWSLTGQGKDIVHYCENKNIELVASFEDNGQSAKNYDRAEWRALEAYVKQYHKGIDYLIVVAYDRFSRNVSEGLAMIQRLEHKFNILVISVTQPIPLHPDNPYYFKFRTDMLVNAEMELRVIRDRAKTGIHRGSLEGRHLRSAPYGYTNARDERNKPVILIDEIKAKHIATVFKLFLRGTSFVEIKHAVEAIGMPIKSNGRIQKLLANPIYAGLINVPAYYDEPQRYVKGIHEGIVSEGDWWKAQALLLKPKREYGNINEALPLKAVVKCGCGKGLTGAASKGKYQHYYYYWCVDHRKENYSAKRMHEQFEAIVATLSLPSHYIAYLQQQTAALLQERNEEIVSEVADYKRRLKDVSKRIDSLEQKYLFEGLDRAVYNKWKAPLEQERYVLQEQVASLTSDNGNVLDRYKENLHLLGNLHHFYSTSTAVGKQAFVRVVFEHGLQYSDGVFRTPFILPCFAPKAALLAEKRLLILEQPEGEKERVSPVCSSADLTRTFIKLIDWALASKKAA